jgi:hypothetical protein
VNAEVSWPFPRLVTAILAAGKADRDCKPMICGALAYVCQLQIEDNDDDAKNVIGETEKQWILKDWSRTCKI